MTRASGGEVVRPGAVEFTRRQREVLRLLAAGKTNPEIGEALGISLDGAKWHVSEILGKLDVATREEAAEWWQAHDRLHSRFTRALHALVPGSVWLKVGAGVAVAAGVLVAGGARGAIFGGGDQGTQGASVAGSAQPGGQEVTQVGITVRVTGFIADDTRTVIGLIVEGRDDLGAAAFPRAQARLVDQKGRIYAESGGKADQENPRLSTHYFPPLDTGTTSVTLEINGLSFAQWDQGRASQDQTPIDAQWRLTIALTNRPATSQLVATDAEPRGLGAGSVVIDQIRQAPSGTVISGHISGFSMDELAELGLTGSLLGNGGSKVDFEALRMGYGEGRQLFEMRFPRVSGQVTLAISGLVPHPHDASIGATLRDKLGDNPTGEWRITLP